MSETQALTVVNNQAPLAKVEAQRNALSRLFTLKPATIELVSKATTQEGATPGKFRITATNQQFDELKVVVLFEPVEQRALYTQGVFSKDAKECFSLDNVQPHPKAKDPKSMYCSECEFGDKGWEVWRKAKASGVSGKALSDLVPRCRKYWHLFVAERTTKMPYYFNVKGTSVMPFERDMQNVARLFYQIRSNIQLENQKITAANAQAGPEAQSPLHTVPQSVGDVIYKIVFTMYSHLQDGQWVLGCKDFAVMSDENQQEFGKILQDFIARRNAGKVQNQVESEAEAEAAEASTVETPAQTSAKEIAEKNSKIVI